VSGFFDIQVSSFRAFRVFRRAGSNPGMTDEYCGHAYDTAPPAASLLAPIMEA
jgi:hypothetical protein